MGKRGWARTDYGWEALEGELAPCVRCGAESLSTICVECRNKESRTKWLLGLAIVAAVLCGWLLGSWKVRQFWHDGMRLMGVPDPERVEAKIRKLRYARRVGDPPFDNVPPEEDLPMTPTSHGDYY